MTTLLVDVSSLLWQSLLVGESKEFSRKVEHEGKLVNVNGWEHGYECAMAHLIPIMDALNLSPHKMIFVAPGAMAKARRKAIYANYKVERDTRPPEATIEFNKCKEALCRTFLNVGSQVVVQDGCEEDDTLAYLCQHIEGEIVILTRDGDMTTLIDDRVSLWQGGRLTKENKYGPFPHKFVPIYKALVGDGNEYKGAAKFGPKAFLDFLVWAGDPGLAALEGMMRRRTLHELEEDVAEFKPLQKIIDSAEHVYQSYECALLHPEWVNHWRQPLQVQTGIVKTRKEVDHRLSRWASETEGEVKAAWWDKLNPPKYTQPNNHTVFDCELIGMKNPVFLVCMHVLETGERRSFWWHKDGDMEALHAQLQRTDLTWVSFNGIHFDAPIMSAAIGGKDPSTLKQMANALIIEEAKSWEMPSRFGYDPIEFDHIDLMEVSPGVRISLKTFAGRMGYPTMVDMPFHHDQDLTADEQVVLENYCQNDLGVTEWLFNRLRNEVELRKEMSEEHGIDLRSKSDAQVAEAILKKAANIKGKAGNKPSYVTYTAPKFIQTDSQVINDLIERLEATTFTINPANGVVQSPEFLDEPLQLGYGSYQCGIGGLHSTHDKCLHVESTNEIMISDFDVASYYPNIMLKAGLTPRLEGGAGERFIAAYREIYDRRIEAKRAGNKKIANALKISLNGTFGKLGSPYSAFYSPDLMLAVTITGQLNLLCLIHDLEKMDGVKVLSANTDGIMVQYPVAARDAVLAPIMANALRTGFEYEETRYRTVAMKDVNNYIAITSNLVPVVISPEDGVVSGKADGNKAKRKGLYASNNPKENPLYLMKNPTFEVCSNMVVDYLRDGVMPHNAIGKYENIAEYVSIRNVKGGGIQFDDVVEVDDWELVLDLGTKDNEWRRPCWPEGKVVKRKSRPGPVEVGIGGQAFGRIARWYMQKDGKLPINYVGSGNKVPKTEGAKLCMTLPDKLPADLDRDWYIAESVSMLGDMGVNLETQGEEQ